MVPFISIASGLGAGNSGCQTGPTVILKSLPFEVDWKAQIIPKSNIPNKWEHIPLLNRELAQATYQCSTLNPFTVVIGGDHSCGIGTWSGVAQTLRDQEQDLGLIWIDAHMDSHTPESSESGNIHGMPLASLLGYGSPALTEILSSKPKVKPQNVFLVGIRSYEEPERNLLEKLNVRVYYMEEVKERGLQSILAEITNYFSRNRIPYGISLDIDFFNPHQMSATGTPVDGGYEPEEFIKDYEQLENYPPIAFEFVEYNPFNDQNNLSLKYTYQILQKVLEVQQASLSTSTNERQY